MKSCPSCGGRFQAPGWDCPNCGSSPRRLDGYASFAPGLANAVDGYRADHYDGLAAAEADSFWFRSRNRLIAWALRDHLGQQGSFLEVGCGTGFVLEGIAAAYPSAVLTGSEVLTAGLEFARARAPQATFLQMDARDIPFEDEFDAVGLFDVLEHIEADDQVLGQVNRALRPGGVVVVTVPQHPWLWSETDADAGHLRRYTSGDLRAKLQRADFHPTQVTSFVALLLPVLAARRRLSGQPDVHADLRAARRLDGAMEQVMRLEYALIRAGVRFPMGGSILAVGRK